jgi:hypothetical protein
MHRDLQKLEALWCLRRTRSASHNHVSNGIDEQLTSTVSGEPAAAFGVIWS